MYVDRHDDIDKNKIYLFIGSIFDYLWLMKLFIESFWNDIGASKVNVMTNGFKLISSAILR